MSLSSLVLAPLQIQAALSVVRDDVSIEYTPMTATKILNELALLDHAMFEKAAFRIIFDEDCGHVSLTADLRYGEMPHQTCEVPVSVIGWVAADGGSIGICR